MRSVCIEYHGGNVPKIAMPGICTALFMVCAKRAENVDWGSGFSVLRTVQKDALARAFQARAQERKSKENGPMKEGSAGAAELQFKKICWTLSRRKRPGSALAR